MSTTSLNDFQIIVFELHDEVNNKNEIYGITIDHVREIRFLDSITKIPNSPNFILGVMNLRGTILPIVDLKEKLGFSHSHKISSKDKILVIEIGSTLIGILIDKIRHIIKIPFENIQNSLSGGLENVSHIMGIAKNDDSLIVLLDIEKLLSGHMLRQIGV